MPRIKGAHVTVSTVVLFLVHSTTTTALEGTKKPAQADTPRRFFFFSFSSSSSQASATSSSAVSGTVGQIMAFNEGEPQMAEALAPRRDKGLR